MSPRLGLPALALLCLAPFAPAPMALAQGPVTVSPTAPPCQCAGFRGPHYHVVGGPATMTRNRPATGRGNAEVNGVSPNEQGLPRGRRYYGGRYFGSFNNRFYGPQYGYF